MIGKKSWGNLGRMKLRKKKKSNKKKKKLKKSKIKIKKELKMYTNIKI